VPLDPDQRFHRRTGGTPSGEEGKLSVRKVAPDQEATRSETG
jgi:hypothetical protein